MGRLILMRHGRTFANAAKVLDTRPPGAELTVIGRTQADDAGRSLATLSRDIRTVTCSIAIRTQQTAVAVLKSYEETLGIAPGTIPLSINADLREIDAGSIEGNTDSHSHDLYTHAFHGWMNGDRSAAMPDGETAGQVVDRMRPVLEELATHDGDHLIVSHGAAMRIVTRFGTNVTADFALQHYIDNTSTIVIDPTGEYGQWKLITWAGAELGAE